ncbi:hypothetical protein ACH42_05905 [Endozoicomonas sp. (ex Bugula neritina AB1)]|nr:hypothetical protein ACH42_05905 [Endozoicomonas sp. (ex Bugula neritina AB1)]
MQTRSDTLAKSVRLAAMDLLARREHSFAELTRKLAQRFSEQVVFEQLSRLRDEKLQSDERFVESYVYSRQQKGYGPMRIRSDLLQNGLASDLISEYVIDDDDCWECMAIELKIRKFGVTIPTDYKVRAKQQRFLMQRGFTFYQISKSFQSIDRG